MKNKTRTPFHIEFVYPILRTVISEIDDLPGFNENTKKALQLLVKIESERV